MLSQRIINSIRKIPARTLSTAREKMLDVTIDNDGIAVMNWQKRPVNSYNREFLQAMKDSLDELESNDKFKGLIMTSGIPKIFSGGVDLTELSNPDAEKFRIFWRTLQDLFLKLYGMEAPTTVAINGHAAAGACLVSLMCDYRVMVNDKSKIGCNDTAIGITPSWWICEIMNRVLGYRQAEIAIATSRMYSPEEALKVQMIDELATDKNDAIDKCKKFIRLHDNIPRSSVKKQLRETAIRYVEENREKDVEWVLRNIQNPYVQKKIEKFVK